MPTSPLPLTLGPTTKAWNLLLLQMQSNANIMRLRPEYQLPSEPNWVNDPPTDRVTIRLSPKLTQGQIIAIAGNGKVVRELTLIVGVDAFIPSDLWQDASNLANAIESAITGSDLQPGPRLALEAQWMNSNVLERVVSLPPDWQQTGKITLTIYSEV